jgi:adenylate cyclase
MPESSNQEYTVVFADICRSTYLFSELGDDKATHLVGQALQVASQSVMDNNGRIIGTIGDELLSVFRQPEEAIKAATQIHVEAAADAELEEHSLKFRIGLNTGPVLVADNTIHGDTVNTAARMAEEAKAGQSIASSATVDSLPEDDKQNLRQLGAVSVRGKSGQTEIFEVLSHSEEEEEITEVRRVLRSSPVSSSITLKFQSQQYRLDHMLVRFALGRLPSCDLVVNHPSISRLHSEIRYINGEFVLQDFSTNGTHVIHKAGPQVIQRQAVTLKGSGKIFLGQTADNRHMTIEFSTFGG